MKHIIKISMLFLAAMSAAGCIDLYTDLSGQIILPVIPRLGPSTTASRVYGQLGSFKTGYPNNGLLVPVADGLLVPGDVTVGGGGVYIADSSNNRVVYYSGTGTTGERFYSGLSAPAGVAAVAGGLYIADAGNNRVLYYSGTSTTAERVYGQGGSFSTTGSNNGGLSKDSLSNPVGVAVDADGVYIADAGNNRVLYYSGTSTTASRVYGQNGSFITNDDNNSTPTADTLNHPNSISIGSGGVYISDNENNRVLYFQGTGTTASRVYGQGGSFTSNAANNGNASPSAGSLYLPSGVAADGTGVYISDGGNNRVLYFSGSRTNASRVYGQSGSFTTNYINDGTPLFPSATGLSGPMGLAVDGGRLYIVDSGNNRVLWY